MNNNLVAVIALLLSVGLFLGYVHPTWIGTVVDTKAAIESNNQALEAVDKYTARESELIAERNAIDPTNLERLTTFLPDSVSNVRLILDLNALAARSGFALSNIDVSANSAGDTSSGGSSGSALTSQRSSNPVGSIDLLLSAVGTYSAFSKFIRGVEQSQRLLDIQNLTVTGSNSGVYNYQMTLRLYWLR